MAGSRPGRVWFGASVAVAASWFAFGPRPAAADSITLYSAQHEQVVDMLTAQFTKETGIAVRVHEGEGPELASQLLAEGSHSPADVFFTENSPELVLLDEHKLLAPVAPATLARVPASDSAPDGHWIGLLARENVLAYNTNLISAGALPASLLDLAQPAWKGKIAIAPADADFLPLVSAVVRLKGKAAALAWLQGLKANAAIYDDDEGVVAAVNRGSVPAGVINSYYWERLTTELGPNGTHSAVYHFGNHDVGALVNVSGAAVLKSSKNPEGAQKFLAFLATGEAQTMLAQSSVDFEYPLVPGIAANSALKPLDQLSPPAIGPAALGDDHEAAMLLREAGLI
ncbi:MAG TPA: extracellular solute-binding protein [Acidocella sp.]|jgi:iron(III) transport system substrate-binding protein|uniref:extracellular solute-binding protein n=1 Tax=Acidocella sp. TaxID=50710 RepID=UPI002C8739B2|nr:extracellular solute-binding protein [Acidocella sp.]HVE20969.1 extracellular solute-binding protein [Acidocella sp.]